MAHPNVRTRRHWPMILVVLTCLGIGFVGGLTARQDAEAKEQKEDPYARLDTFAQVLTHIESHYVEDVDHQTLIYGSIKGMVRALDPHSTFMTPDELTAMRERSDGAYVGIGIEVGMRDGAITIIAPLPGGPADEAGIKSGDIIIEVEGKSMRNKGIDDAVELLRGERDTNVKLKVRREGEKAPLSFELTRNTVKVISVQYELLEEGYGIIAVRSFVRNVGHDVRKAYDDLVTQNGDEKLKGIILDLRNNPGGLLREAVDITNIFLENGTIVTTEGRNGLELAKHTAAARRHYVDAPIVVLVNRGSASASEIVAGALQDHNRGVIVGTQTFGKGSVQNIYTLEEGSGLKLTIARYYTPDHRSIQGIGITPDIWAEDVKIPDPEGEGIDFSEQDLEGTLGNEQKNGKGMQIDPSRDIRDLPVRTGLDQLKAHRILSGQDK